MKIKFILAICFIAATITSCLNDKRTSNDLDTQMKDWVIDFMDEFESFDTTNWQDQRIWVNNEKQCYVPDNADVT